MEDDVRTCRYCHKREHGLIHYSVRSYAHGRCLFMHWEPKDHRFFNLGLRARTMAVLEKLPVGVLGHFRMCDFDRDGGKVEVGISAADFMTYWEDRRRESAQ
jgi:hypothetical protein